MRFEWSKANYFTTATVSQTYTFFNFSFPFSSKLDRVIESLIVFFPKTWLLSDWLHDARIMKRSEHSTFFMVLVLKN